MKIKNRPIKLRHLLYLIVTFSLVACSGQSSDGDVSLKPSDEVDFAVDSGELSKGPDMAKLAEPDHSLVDEANRNLTAEVKPEEKKVVMNTPPEGMETPLERPIEPTMRPQVEETPVAIASTPMPNTSEKLSSDLLEYKLKKGETLMLVAFKLYGDYSKWKDLKALNSKKILKAGSVLKYHPPSEAFVWQPQGLPHLVMTGDTLGSISKSKYGHKKYWKKIYENNRPIIKNPNLIFAGFTLYYVPMRDVASEKK